jgi:hypothetical protein
VPSKALAVEQLNKKKNETAKARTEIRLTNLKSWKKEVKLTLKVYIRCEHHERKHQMNKVLGYNYRLQPRLNGRHVPCSWFLQAEGSEEIRNEK